MARTCESDDGDRQLTKRVGDADSVRVGGVGRGGMGAARGEVVTCAEVADAPVLVEVLQ